MASGDGGDANFVEGVGGLPPVHFLNLRILCNTFGGEARADAERNRESRPPLRADATQRGHIEMIVVIVTLQNQINGGKLIEVNSRRAVARRSDPGKRAGAMGPDGIAKNIEALHLDQKRGMADERGADFSVVYAFGWSGTRRRVNPFAPGRGPASAQPFEDAGAAVRHGGHAVARIEKMLAVEVVGNRSAIKWHLGLGCVNSPWQRWLLELLEPDANIVSYLRRTRLS
jgi:hypothetical protein